MPGCRTVREIGDGGFRSDGHGKPDESPHFATLAWRLCHIIDFLCEDRNAPWLGVEGIPILERTGDAGSAEAALLRDLYAAQ